MRLYSALSPPQRQSQCALQHIITGTGLYIPEQASIPLGGIQVSRYKALQLRQPYTCYAKISAWSLKEERQT